MKTRARFWNLGLGMFCFICFIPWASAQVGTTWEWRNPLPHGITLNGVAWGADHFVAVGLGGTIMTSPDGVAWTVRTSGTSKELKAIRWAGGQFVVLGAEGTLLTSPDGIAWTARASGTTVALLDVCQGPGQLVAVGWATSGEILTSADNGVTWVKRSSPIRGLKAITWAEGKYVIATSNDDVLTSTNGVNWSRHITGIYGERHGVLHDGERFVMYGATNLFLSSVDAVTWTRLAVASGRQILDVIWADGRYLAVGQPGLLSNSADGITWIDYPTGTIQDINAVAWSGSRYVAVGTGGITYTSLDGVDWTRQGSGTFPHLTDVAWSGSAFAAVGSRVSILTSVDGVHWRQTSTSSSFAGLNRVRWLNGLFVAVGTNGLILTSPCGSEWTQRDSGTTSELTDVIWTGTRFLVVGKYQPFVFSEDGITWTPGPFEFIAYDSIAYSPYLNRYVLSSGSTMYTSNDAETWTAHALPRPYCTYRDIIWAGDRFVAVGSEWSIGQIRSTILISMDGIHWGESRFGDPFAIYGVAWTGSQFVATGSSGVILTSPDGITWTLRPTPPTIGLRGLTWADGQLIAVGWEGAIFGSGPPPKVLSVLSHNPAEGVAIGSSTGHGGETAYVRVVTPGSPVQLEAPAFHGSGAERRRFDGWTGAITDPDPTLSFTFHETMTLVANYVDATCLIDLAVEPEAAGTVSGDGIHGIGEPVTVTANPAFGYFFDRWTEDGTMVSTHAAHTFIAEHDRDLVAHFLLHHYNVAYTAGAGGAIVGEAAQTVPHGGAGSEVGVLAEEGAVFDQWSDGLDTPERTEAAVMGDLVLTAHFKSTGGVSIDWYAHHSILPEAGETWADLDVRYDPAKRMSLREQFIALLDPTDPASLLRSTVVAGGGGISIWIDPHSSTRVYTLYFNPGLEEAGWQVVPGQYRIPGGSGPLRHEDPLPTMIYRVGVEVP